MTYLTRPERTRNALVMLGQAVRRARARSALSQRDLEALSGVDQTAISRMERGLAPGMGLEKFARVAVVLAGHLLANDTAQPEHQYAPLIASVWLPPGFGTHQPAASDASSRLTEVGRPAFADADDADDPDDPDDPGDPGDPGYARDRGDPGDPGYAHAPTGFDARAASSRLRP